MECLRALQGENGALGVDLVADENQGRGEQMRHLQASRSRSGGFGRRCHLELCLDSSCASRKMECLRSLQGENGALGVDLVADENQGRREQM
jgi:hypothetical protein